MDLSVVVLSYNTRDLLEQALRSVMDASAGLAVEIIVADNASSDGSAEMVATKFCQVRLIRSSQNLGFAAGNNLALRQVEGRYVMLLNPDTIVRRDTLRCLVAFLDAHPEAGAAGCKVLNPDGTLQLECRRGFPTPMAAFCKMSGISRLFPRNPRLAAYNLTYLDPEQVNEVDALSGSCMVVRKTTMDQVGFLDEDYFMYGEDLDWCYRIRQAGWKIFYTPDTEIIHFKGESGRAEPMKILFRKKQAMAIFVGKHMQQRYRFFPLWLLHVGIVVQGILSFASRLLRAALLPLLDGGLVLVGIKLGLNLRYNPVLAPLLPIIEKLGNRLGLEAYPTRWFDPPSYTDLQWFKVYAATTAIWLVCFYLIGLYDRRKYSAAWALGGVTLGFAVIVTTIFFFKTYNFSRLAVAAAWAINGVLVAGWRLAVGWLKRTSPGLGLGRRRMLVVGADETAVELLDFLRQRSDLEYEVIGLVADTGELRGREISGKQVVGLVGELRQLVREYEVSELVFTSDMVGHALKGAGRRWQRQQLRLRMIPGSFAQLTAGQAYTSVDQLPLIEISTPS